jgi:hypothetical protein
MYKLVAYSLFEVPPNILVILEEHRALAINPIKSVDVRDLFSTNPSFTECHG